MEDRLEPIQLEVLYTPRDFVAAALSYRKVTGDTKTFIIVCWLIVILAFVYFLFPGVMLPLLCLPFGTCTIDVILQVVSQLFFVGGFCCLILIAAYTNLPYRIRVELESRNIFNRLPQSRETKKMTIDVEGISTQDTFQKSTTYWKSFQQAIETPISFLLPIGKDQYFLIPKRVFNDSGDVVRFRDLVIERTGQQIKAAKS